MARKLSFTPTDEQLRKVLTELRKVPDRPVGDHLTEDQAVWYVTEAKLTGEERAAIEKHLISCEMCCDDLNELYLVAGTEEEVE